MRVLPKMAAAATALVLVGAACGGSSKSASPSEPTSTVNTAPPAGPSPVVEAAAEQERMKQEVLDAYLAGWKAKRDSNDPPNPDWPALAETHTGPALQQVVDNRRAFQITGRVGRYPEGSVAREQPEVVTVQEDQATVRDCRVDDSQIVITSTGQVVNDLVGTALFEAAMVVEDGRWKVRSLKVIDEWDGVAGCALE